METVLFPDFLKNSDEYALSERYWVELWERVEPPSRSAYKWTYQWLSTGSALIKDGNPIFSAHSRVLRRGVRVVQLEPFEPGLDIQAWLDTFGGDITDPNSIHELVIACVLSETAAVIALSLMSQWAQGLSPSFSDFGPDAILPSSGEAPPEIVTTLGFAA